jgi:hypothetical protein
VLGTGEAVLGTGEAVLGTALGSSLVGERVGTVVAGAALVGAIVGEIVGEFEKTGLTVVGARVGQARSIALLAIPGAPTEVSCVPKPTLDTCTSPELA